MTKEIEELQKRIEELYFLYERVIDEEYNLRENEEHSNPRHLYFELKAELKGFLAGQNSQKEKDLEMIREFNKSYSWHNTEILKDDLWIIMEDNTFSEEQKRIVLEEVAHLFGGHLLEELAQKIKGDENEL